MIQQTRGDFICGLLVGLDRESQQLMLNLFREAGWRLHQARDRKRALEHLDRQPVQVVVADAQVPTWPWKRALQDLQRMSRPPQLIVSSRHADETLWAEVLNWGAYDLLAQPLQRDEVARVIAAARRHFDPPIAAARAHAAAS